MARKKPRYKNLPPVKSTSRILTVDCCYARAEYDEPVEITYDNFTAYLRKSKYQCRKRIFLQNGVSKAK